MVLAVCRGSKIASIEAQLGFRVPDDFAYLFQHLQDAVRVLFPWSEFDRRKHDEIIEWVFRGIEFDIENNFLWLERWRKKPDTIAIALDVARKDFLIGRNFCQSRRGYFFTARSQ